MSISLLYNYTVKQRSTTLQDFGTRQAINHVNYLNGKLLCGSDDVKSCKVSFYFYFSSRSNSTTRIFRFLSGKKEKESSLISSVCMQGGMLGFYEGGIHICMLGLDFCTPNLLH